MRRTKDMAMVENQWCHHFGIAAPPILEPILVGVRAFDPWPHLVRHEETSEAG